MIFKTYSSVTVTNTQDGIDGVSPVNIIMSNESQNIPCTSSGNASSSMLIEIPFYGFKGLTRVNCTASVGVLPSGVTLGSNTNSTTTTEGKIVLNVSAGATFGNSNILYGEINITFKIEQQSIVRKFSWSKTKDGTPGRMYSLETSTLVIKKGADNVLVPSEITFSSFYRDGDSANRSPYNGRFVIAESNNGSTFNNKYMSSTDESSKNYTPTSSSVKIIKCTLYASNSVLTKLDEQSIIVLTDIENIEPELEEIRNEISGVSSKIDAVEKSIKDEVWKDTMITVIDSDGNTIKKSLESLLIEHNISLNGISTKVSDITTELDPTKEGSVIHSLTEKISLAEQDAEGFRQTVEKNYMTNSAFDEEAEKIRTEMEQTAEGFQTEVTGLDNKITKSIQDLNGFKNIVEGTYISKDNLDVGTRNLIRNSKTMIFDSYHLISSE